MKWHEKTKRCLKTTKINVTWKQYPLLMQFESNLMHPIYCFLYVSSINKKIWSVSVVFSQRMIDPCQPIHCVKSMISQLFTVEIDIRANRTNHHWNVMTWHSPWKCLQCLTVQNKFVIALHVPFPKYGCFKLFRPGCFTSLSIKLSTQKRCHLALFTCWTISLCLQ